ncbi:MAG: hypothetical protein ACI9BF_000259 [Candidatus Paceibacteria bacterium]
MVTLAYPYSVGRSINLMNNSDIHVMNKYYKTIASMMVVFALMLPAFVTPVSTVFAQLDPQDDISQSSAASSNSVTRCSLLASRNIVTIGEGVTLYWDTAGFDTITIDGQPVTGNSGSQTIGNMLENTTFTLEASNDNGSSNCTQHVSITCIPPEVPIPSCDLFTATPNAITTGASATLAWETSNSVQVFLNNGIGAVDLDGSIEVSPLADIVYQLTVIGAEDQSVDCEVPITVSADSVPVCEFFTATPGTLPAGGGNVVLNWEVLNANNVTILPTVGSVGLVDSSSVNITESTTFTLTAVDEDGDTVTCPAPVVVVDPEVFTCANNVSFSVSDTSILRGTSINLDWSTINVDSVSISGINATTLSGTESVSPSNDITYVLTATQGSETINCPISVTVSGGGGGGGGGGSSSPRCDLDISDTKIKLGEEITLTWDTSRATEVTLTDDRGNIIFTTDDYIGSNKEDSYDGSIKLKPTRDTEYTLLAERGSRDKECPVKVEIEDTIVVLQTRDQQSLVAGISLAQVPYTGFEAGSFLTAMFYLLLITWTLYITYLLVIRNQRATSDFVANNVFNDGALNHDLTESIEIVRPDVVATSVDPDPVDEVTPTNLPIGNTVIRCENIVAEDVVNPREVSDEVVTNLENRAHAQKALLSSDAVRYLVCTIDGEEERNNTLDAVITEAKKTYPLEDGWIVINESRMQNLCDACKGNSLEVKDIQSASTTVPEGTGSLAEAIVIGNVVAAYQMIGNRPMFALADAATDLDAVYRHRRGIDAQVSDMLIAETKNLTDEKIKNMIDALTGALDGTYTDEASAVKMAIMKAVKEAS